MKSSFIQNFKADLPASIVVFFVALPLCLGIALASGAPLFSGLIAGIVGGILVGALSGSQIGVSGPAAGCRCRLPPFSSRVVVCTQTGGSTLRRAPKRGHLVTLLHFATTVLARNHKVIIRST